MKKTISLAVGIPAYNEEKNIGFLLADILEQEIDPKFRLEKIVVVCDGCTDQTESIVKKFKISDSRISVRNDHKRLGLSQRLTQLFRSTRQEVLITFDADTRLGSKLVINEIAKKFINPNVGLVGGNDTPARAKNLIQKIGVTWVEAWYQMRYKISGGDTVHNHKGCVSAGRTTFLKTVSIPKNIHSSDDFVYFSCKRAGLLFKFANRAIVYYSIPDNLQEYFTQSVRFLNIKKGIVQYFGDWVNGYYIVPLKNKLYGLLKIFLKKPFYLLLAVMLQVYMRIKMNKYIEDYTGVSWRVISSSKYEK